LASRRSLGRNANATMGLRGIEWVERRTNEWRCLIHELMSYGRRPLLALSPRVHPRMVKFMTENLGNCQLASTRVGPRKRSLTLGFEVALVPCDRQRKSFRRRSAWLTTLMVRVRLRVKTRCRTAVALPRAGSPVQRPCGYLSKQTSRRRAKRIGD
jgi:hypothetical protein